MPGFLGVIRDALGLTRPLLPTDYLIGAPLSGRQRLRNGAFRINQRVVAGTVVLAAGAYGHDGWKAGVAGCTYTFASAANGDAVLTITAGSLVQIVPLADVADAGPYTLSQAGTAPLALYQGSSAAGLPFATGPLTLTLSGSGGAVVEAGLGTLSKVQLEPGLAATPFERRGDDLLRCQEWFFKTYNQGEGPGKVGASYALTRAATGTGTYETLSQILFPYPMRVAPTVTVYAPSTGVSGKATRVNASNADVSAGATAVTQAGATVSVINVALNAGEGVAVHVVADASP